MQTHLTTKVKDMKFSQKRRQMQFRTIYELFDETPRIQIKDIREVLGGSRGTVRKRIKEAFDLGCIVGPHIRKRSFKNFVERVYIIKCEDPFELHEKYKKDKDVVYHAIMKGFADFLAISKKKLTIDGDILVEGFRSDYRFSYAPNCSWEYSIQDMQNKVKNFRPEEYIPQGLIETHWNESIKWDKKDELLFDELKYNVRMPLESLVKDKLHIGSGRAYEWLERLPECCTIFTCYFPETIAAYDPYLFMFDTDYEDFIVDLFSRLPTTTSFFKVSDKLFVDVHIDRGFMRNANSLKPNINALAIPLMVRDLVKRGILKTQADAIVRYYWREDMEDMEND